MSAITTHVLDVARGQPAVGIAVVLELQASGGKWQTLGRGTTDTDGRLGTLLPDSQVLAAGTYRLSFDVGTYFQKSRAKSFYSTIPIVFDVSDVAQHYHIPLLLSPFGYSTYRGS
jgi:5-hydroxyisourate hydrolase